MLKFKDLKIKEGLYLVDKPKGPSSHDVVNYFRRQSGIKRVGHCGTLDPLATGLLIILVGRDFTKLQSNYIKSDKEYLVTAILGISTDSYDANGQITSQAKWEEFSSIDKKEFIKTLEKFKGSILQTVPIFSAVKVAGQKLYQKARRGEIVDLPERQILIDKLKLIGFDKDVKHKEFKFTLQVNCSSGTYVRSLIHDIGQKLKVGAHVVELRRTKIGNFHVKNSINLE